METLAANVIHYDSLSNTYASNFRFTFTQLDAGDPTRSFSFVLNINDEDTYEVEDTLPPVDSIILHELLEKLNETDDLSVFCCGMRKYCIM